MILNIGAETNLGLVTPEGLLSGWPRWSSTQPGHQ